MMGQGWYDGKLTRLGGGERDSSKEKAGSESRHALARRNVNCYANDEFGRTTTSSLYDWHPRRALRHASKKIACIYRFLGKRPHDAGKTSLCPLPIGLMQGRQPNCVLSRKFARSLSSIAAKDPAALVGVSSFACPI